MAEYTIDKFTYGGNTYKLKDKISGFITTDEKVSTGSVSINSKYYLVFGSDTATAETKYRDVSMSASFTNENSINYATLSLGRNSGVLIKGRLAFIDSNYTGILTNTTLTADRTWTLPDKTGTIALTSDIATHTTATVTLTTTWTSNQQSVTVSGVTTSNTVIVTPAPASYDEYCAAGIYCSAQAANSLTFKCEEAPSSSLTVNILIVN